MKRSHLTLLLVLVLVLVLVVAPAARAQNVEPLINGLANRDQFRLTWRDEFDGSTLDAAKWNHEFAGKRWDAFNTPDAVSVGGGNLAIRTYSAPYNGGQRHYTGAVSTRQTFSQAYGYFESRIDFSDAPGMWSAFWVHSARMTGNLPPELLNRPDLVGSEIDVVEHRSNDQWGTNYEAATTQAVHWNGYEPNQRSLGNVDWNHDVGNGYHTFGLLWARDRYEYYIDGQRTWIVNEPMAISSLAQFVILSSEVRRNSWSGSPSAAGYGSLATTGTMMKVDYVRVFAFNQDGAVTPEPATLLSATAATLALARRIR